MLKFKQGHELSISGIADRVEIFVASTLGQFTKKLAIITAALLVVLTSVFLISGAAKATTATDTFTDTAGTLLENHTSESGYTWNRNTSYPNNIMVISNNDRLRNDNGSIGPGTYSSSWIPASPDYEVSADIYIANAGTGDIGIGGRTGTTGFSGYYALWSNSGMIRLFRAGNASPLAIYYTTPAVGSTNNLKLSMNGNDISVYWNNVAVMSVTATGSNIISTVGRASIYSEGRSSDSTGPHLDNFSANDIQTSTFAPGVLQEVTHTVNTVNVAWTVAGGGSAPITAQLQRSPESANTWTNVSGATSSPAADIGLVPYSTYDYRVAYSDSTSTTVYSNIVSITADNLAPHLYSIQASDLWDNSYDNIANPRQSPFARFVFTTDADSITVTGTSTIHSSYPSYAHLGIRVDGVDKTPLQFNIDGTRSFTVQLGAAGTTRTVEVISGLQSEPAVPVKGTFIDSISYPHNAVFTIIPPLYSSRVLIYGDSIAVGGNSTNPEYQGYLPVLRNTYGFSVTGEAWGYRTLFEDAKTSQLRNALVDRIANSNPSVVYLAIGTNDYGLSRWSAPSFGAAYLSLLDELHAALPSARLICQTPIIRGTETANSFSNTTQDYRDQIATACSGHAWSTFVDGAALLDTSDLADGVHPTTAGHAKYAKRIAPLLASPAYTVSGPTTGLIDQASAPFTVNLTKANFLGDQSVTLSVPDGTLTATAIGGDITSNGTNSVTVKPANNTTDFSFVYKPAAHGSRAITLTNGQSWVDPTPITLTVPVDPDIDNDGITSDIENAAPNNGDANNDGIQDSQQQNLASFVSPVSGKYVSLAVSSGCDITNVTLEAKTDRQVQEKIYSYPNGLMNFTLDCGTIGTTTSVTQYYYDDSNENYTLQKYNPSTDIYSTVTNASISHEDIDNSPVTVVNYQVTDGGEYDTDGLTDGVIVDPVGLAITTETNTSGPNSSTSNNITELSKLANTGANIYYIIVASLISIGGGIYVVKRQRPRSTKK